MISSSLRSIFSSSINQQGLRSDFVVELFVITIPREPSHGLRI